MPLQDDQSVAPDAILYRVLVNPNWIKKTSESRRPSSIAFYEADGQVSFFVEGPNVVDELKRVFPNAPIARVPAATIRAAGLVVVRRPSETHPDLQCDANSHVVVGPAENITRNEFERRARRIATDSSVSIIDP